MSNYLSEMATITELFFEIRHLEESCNLIGREHSGQSPKKRKKSFVRYCVWAIKSSYNFSFLTIFSKIKWQVLSKDHLNSLFGPSLVLFDASLTEIWLNEDNMALSNFRNCWSLASCKKSEKPYEWFKSYEQTGK